MFFPPSLSDNVCIFIFFLRATCFSLIAFRGIIALTIGHEEYKLLSFVLCIFFPSFCHSLLPSENVFPVAQFSWYYSVTSSACPISSLHHWPWIMWPDTSAFWQLFEKNYDRKEMPLLALCTADIHSPFAASCAAVSLHQHLLPFTYYVSVVYDFRPNIFDKSLRIYESTWMSVPFAWIVASSSSDLPTQWTGKSIDMRLSCLYTFLVDCCCLLRWAKLPAVPLSRSTVQPIDDHSDCWYRIPKGSVRTQRAEGMRIIRSKRGEWWGGVPGGWGKCHSEVLCNLYYLQRLLELLL